MLRTIERVDGRKALEAGKLLVLEPALLEQVRNGGSERQGEERYPDEVTDDVKWQQRAAETRLVVDRADEARSQQEGQGLRRHERPHDIDPVAHPRQHVGEAGEQGGDAEREVDALDRTHVQNDRPERDVRRMEGYPDGDQTRRPLAHGARLAEQIRDEDHGRCEIHGRGGRK